VQAVVAVKTSALDYFLSKCLIGRQKISERSVQVVGFALSKLGMGSAIEFRAIGEIAAKLSHAFMHDQARE
jgi:hypothetical protein